MWKRVFATLLPLLCALFALPAVAKADVVIGPLDYIIYSGYGVWILVGLMLLLAVGTAVLIWTFGKRRKRKQKDSE
ncbi:MAG: hypothetical protein FWF10_07415 [Clostridiales bacterium]|nr:hypothetical protein [Clostridiales bacterium]